MKNPSFKSAVLALLFIVITLFANAQSWSVSGKTVELSMDAIVYIETAYQRPGAPAGVKDTLTGTAFLVADSDKVYLVTAKHLVTAALSGKNQRRAAHSIFISSTWKSNDKGMKLSGLSDGAVDKRPFVFSSDQEDIAIISLQKNKYRQLLTALIKQECKPIPVDSIDASNDHHPGETFFLPVYSSIKDKTRARIRTKSISPGKIKTFNVQSPSFLIDHYISQGNNGAPVILDDKIIGIVSNAADIITNTDIIGHPFHVAQTARVTKASRILSLLKKLQQIENSPGFN